MARDRDVVGLSANASDNLQKMAQLFFVRLIRLLAVLFLFLLIKTIPLWIPPEGMHNGPAHLVSTTMVFHDERREGAGRSGLLDPKIKTLPITTTVKMEQGSEVAIGRDHDNDIFGRFFPPVGFANGMDQEHAVGRDLVGMCWFGFEQFVNSPDLPNLNTSDSLPSLRGVVIVCVDGSPPLGHGGDD